MSYLVPTVLEKKGGREVAYDIYSRLLEDRIIFIGESVTTDLANLVIAQLLFLDKEGSDDIQMYINCFGGGIAAGLSIIDTMSHIKSDVSTIAVGMAASMGAMILACGTEEKRLALPNAEVMLHQPSIGEVGGQAKEIEIVAEHMAKTRERLYGMISKRTGKPKSRIEKDADRDYWMTATEAKKYGIIDRIIR